MIDKPHGFAEQKICDFADYVSGVIGDAKEVYKAGHDTKIGKWLIRLLIVMIIALIGMYFTTPKQVTVITDYYDHIDKKVYETKAFRMEKFLEENPLDYVDGVDTIDAVYYETIRNGHVINIQKAVQVNVKADGEVQTYVTLPPVTVGEALEHFNITLGENDVLVDHEMSDTVESGETITIQRIAIKYVTEEEVSNFKTVYKEDPNMACGKTEVTTKGRKGIKRCTYVVVTVDDEVISKTLTSEETVKKVRNKVISYGTKILNGVPKDLKYIKKYSHVRAVSYNYTSGPRRGVYGERCAYGTCAVDRNLIPLGSLLYIEGYGYAIANDVGTGVKQKTVDLYMDKRSQCATWGARWTNVYVISYGNDKAFWE